jgi:hypothetical protein
MNKVDGMSYRLSHGQWIFPFLLVPKFFPGALAKPWSKISSEDVRESRQLTMAVKVSCHTLVSRVSASKSRRIPSPNANRSLPAEERVVSWSAEDQIEGEGQPAMP